MWLLTEESEYEDEEVEEEGEEEPQPARVTGGDYVPRTDVIIIPARYWNQLPGHLRSKIGKVSSIVPFGGT